MDSARLERLIERHFDGDLSIDEFRALDDAIAGDPQAALLLRRRADEELAFTKALGRPIPAFAPPTIGSWIRAAWIRAAAAILIVAAGLAIFIASRPRPWVYEGDALFALRDDGSLAPARAVLPERRYYARSGRVRLGAAEVAFREPTVFLADSPGRGERQPISLVAGDVRVATAAAGAGVLVRTEKGTLRDIGTIFDVKLNNRWEERDMLARIRANALPVFVAATVLTGSVAWESRAGETKILGPESGTVNLAYDPSLGTVADREGLVYVRPVGGERWTLADDGTSIETGDWVKTGARGANAAEIRLADGGRLVLGPGGLLEIAALGTLRLAAGELEVAPIQGVRIRVEGPGGAVREVEKAEVLRAAADGLTALDAEPRWLAGYEAKASTEAMGSLLAKIDDRDVPLTIGYHKVTVDIRDQIARTMIEESFVNHADSTLEGVFYFPLPQDSSISGFAMWIGGELVEADIVEKERAREIYEEILREKRDPGLLEWTGGNIFKARVYPIFAHSEKRIRITYTEVLPKQGNAYRYTYALRSEMLRLTPLRQLEMRVTISSAQPIASVACPSHAARIRKTEHAAQVEFSAEEYSPRRDFEVRVETAPSAGNIVLIPRRRGDDGTFMVLLSSMGEGGGRKLLRDSEPVDILLVADTSASMTDAQVDEQRAFIASLLESLGERDLFNLLAFDVDAAWAFPERVPVTAATRESALRFLDRRGALGWTDLDLAFREAIARARDDTHVIYVGDGMITTGEADPDAFAKRLRAAYRGQGSFHAVGVGSTYDLTSLRAIASLGGGSLQRSGAGKDAPQMAAALLDEITAPGLRDIELAWDGIRVARVYPEILPNLPKGKEQFILGRYLVEDREQTGKLRVTGTLDGKPVAYEVDVAFPKADEGNSFIPRFWARMHLDHLLEQGRDPENIQRIIALSEDYQIITPYTSFLVLESDADRERFQVKKRFRMRGGEEFFAEGREAAGYELARQQMLAAKRWRQKLRAQVLALYDGMGRNLARPQVRRFNRRFAYGAHGRYDQWGTNLYFADEDLDLGAHFAITNGAVYHDFFDASLSLGEIPLLGKAFHKDAEERDPFAEGVPLLVEHDDPVLGGLEVPGFLRFGVNALDGVDFAGDDFVMMNGGFARLPQFQPTSGLQGWTLGTALDWDVERYARMKYPSRPQPPFASLFPTPGGARKPFEGKWPAEIRRLIERCGRRSSIASLRGGIEIAVETDAIDFRGRTVPGLRARFLLSPSAWAATSAGAPG
ncbi:MAG: VWA domain-containing protein, partial [Planctomycetes bacterium]|nr:VWA domain-containing protein [Planctomycetota bacterium]